jgi:hypothetical protein
VHALIIRAVPVALLLFDWLCLAVINMTCRAVVGKLSKQLLGAMLTGIGFIVLWWYGTKR